MKGSKGKVTTIIIILVTLILAGVAVFTAIRLYQLRQTSVSPIAPSSQPKAQETTPPAAACSLSFTLTVSTSSPSPSSTPAETPSSTPSSTPGETPTTPGATPNSCGGTCGSNFNCESNLVCYQGSCRNPECTSSTSCVCGGTSTSTPAPSLPQSGTDWPTIAGAGIGILVIIGSLLLAL